MLAGTDKAVDVKSNDLGGGMDLYQLRVKHDRQ